MTLRKAQPWIGARHARFSAAVSLLEALLAISSAYRKKISELSAAEQRDNSEISAAQQRKTRGVFLRGGCALALSHAPGPGLRRQGALLLD
jgi:hypothetical protein